MDSGHGSSFCKWCPVKKLTQSWVSRLHPSDGAYLRINSAQQRRALGIKISFGTFEFPGVPAPSDNNHIAQFWLAGNSAWWCFFQSCNGCLKDNCQSAHRDGISASMHRKYPWHCKWSPPDMGTLLRGIQNKYHYNALFLISLLQDLNSGLHWVCKVHR